ncbi:GNAT family N-acetyltransferase [Candidatus Viridilinea mediisalina]|uniref:N-acetyltransferase domain-containing protein n=1 Tax=Candidatus Viridilinea mediisalina TaxID=2024553 RepID=A0A2A6RLP7_9CHLR|nr:GNAT family N-acetyltransferase [Candidatus Viridilinea mediisalina]PDW04024.1 hypothetical protein CJ255_05480 [Candidatus Viridilinea mediisalina]
MLVLTLPIWVNMMVVDKLQIRSLEPNDVAAFATFLADAEASGAAHFFHPHDFSATEAQRICTYTGQDAYYALWIGQRIAVYGMLRGWDSGYDMPSLGVIVSSQDRRQGLGQLFMSFLHCAAKLHGAQRIRLKVYPENEPALHLYQQLGYQFTASEAGQLVGYIEL